MRHYSKEGSMAGPVAEIDKILNEELRLYTDLYELEEKKSDAIVSTDGKALESAAAGQETILARVAKLEKARRKYIAVYAEMNRLNDLGREVTLSDVVRLMDEDSSCRLLATGMELRKLLTRIAALHETNQRLIADNLEFFEMLMSGLKSTVSVNTGYSEKGMERSRVAGSLIFNRRI
jgi:flagellar biosynthesis/type III secretory pathway chaperone